MSGNIFKFGESFYGNQILITFECFNQPKIPLKTVFMTKTCLRIFMFLFISSSFASGFAQTTMNDSTATIHFIRPKKSMMSGVVALNVQITRNDQKIADLPNGLMVNYVVRSKGAMEFNFQAEYAGSPTNAPKMISLQVEPGKIFYIWVDPGMSVLNVKEIDKKHADKYIDNKKLIESVRVIREK